MSFRPTIRLRLTLIYGGLFLAAGAVLLTLNYALVRRGLERQAGPIGVSVEAGLPGSVGFAPDENVQFVRPAPQIVTTDGQRLEDVLLTYQAKLRDDTLHELVVQSIVALGLMAVGSVGLGWVVAGRALAPLSRVTGAARRLSQDNLHERLALGGPQDELKELADTFDAMLGRLEAAFESQRRFVANASHELRTPLSIQRTLVDVALADPDTSPDDLRIMAAALRDAVDRSERLIDGLLVLARSEQGNVPREPVDLAAAVVAALDQSAVEAVAGGLRVERTLVPATVTGSRVLVERLVGNLVQNAVRHNAPGGWVAVATTPEGRVRVTNSGPVVPPDQVEALFEPFRRLAPDRVESARGVGLGLSIVRSVVKAHGGEVRATARAGGGLDVTVSLPVAAA
ncbi:MAG TPA: ATP-binding protein, partial [Acidimicrobiales bacterium]